MDANTSGGMERLSDTDGRFVRSVQAAPTSMLRQAVRNADAPTVKRFEKMVRLALLNRRIMESQYYNALRRQRKNIDAILDRRRSLRAKKQTLQKGGFLALLPVLASLAANAVGPAISLIRDLRKK